MTLQPGSERGQRSPETHQDPSPSEDELVEIQHEGSDDGDTTDDRRQQQHPEQKRRTRSTSPAYVAPIPKIGPIPPVSPSPGIQVPFTDRPQLPQFVGSYLVGKAVNEFGEIVDEKTAQVLARTGGDLPSMVGRKVSNRQGDILGDDGELLGYVADIERRAGSSASGQLPRMPSWPPMMSLAEIMGRSNASLMVDHLGNILDLGGNVVGKFHDNNNPMHRKEREEQQRQEAEAASASKPASAPKLPETPPKSCRTPPPRAAAENEPEKPRQERQQQNAHSWRKENESPSDIFLDVKSTTEGIQLTIRIPTVFNGSQVRPTTIQFS